MVVVGIDPTDAETADIGDPEGAARLALVGSEGMASLRIRAGFQGSSGRSSKMRGIMGI